MCWITFSSASSRKRRATPVPYPSGPRIITIPPEPEIHHRHQHVRIVVPTTAFPSDHTHKSHLHHHRHHLHPRPDTLRGHGIKRATSPPPPPPPSPTGKSVHFSPDLRSSKLKWPWIADPLPRAPKEETTAYRTVYASPPPTRRRESTTRSATRDALGSRDRRSPGRLRRVAGYDVLASEVPWSWDCIEEQPRRKRRGDRLNYPPFGPSSSWM
ncbi:uncharacterized protein BDZ99DRAFT_66006 [Mytilinidion resinicola]|uniref:Uncharacterized protein n=1 Tax=Mytilinidion resinicola TaxID=574789 RepID=A0A6A6YGR6_9PEZI|nr:uncharacterized protein BDZ99DRAFT_66006 [Mytilinidion resinicola]KAF2807789.1 hypothetical protein BDZ99DRAFT_66006 [Mytilinidion resinicola]